MMFLLDHIGVAVHDLNIGEAKYRELGFNLTSRSLHVGSVPGELAIRRWGSGNHCAMFRQGYLEIQGVTDKALDPPVKRLLKSYEGAHIVALGCDDANKTYEDIVRRVAFVRPPIVLERDAPFGKSGTETRRAQFRIIYFDPVELPECRLLIIEHKTPDVLWQPHLLDHPNTAIGLEEAIICTNDVADSSRRFETVLGCTPQIDAEKAVFKLDRGKILIASPAASLKLGIRPAKQMNAPFVSAFTVTVSNIDMARQWMRSHHIEIQEWTSSSSFKVDPASACGTSICFAQAT